KALATVSEETVLANPRPRKRRLKKLKRLQRALSHTVHGSHKRRKAARRLGKQHHTVAQQRANTWQQVTSGLAKTPAVVVIEDLLVWRACSKNHRLARAIAGAGCAEFRRHRVYQPA